MKKKLTLVTFAAAFAAMFGMNLDSATAQFAAGPRLGSQVAEPDTFRRVASDLNIGVPGRVWVSTNFADEGLGYNGSYLTIGGKTRLAEDFLDGRWLGEARLHHSIEDDGGFFANIGVERVFSVKSAGAEVTTGFWYDFDGDQQGNFGNDFSQVGANAAIKTRRWDLIGNGYFPVGVRNRTSAATADGTFFQGNNIVLTPGIDSALTGFDVTLRMRPKSLAFMNGSFDIAGYGYSSDLVNSFGGGRVRLTGQSQRGLIVSAEVNHDDRFETTGVLSLGYVFGAVGGRNSEYAGIGRDLEETVRNDHIVRFNQDVVLAIDPETGAAFNVVHVSDDAGDGGDGTFENPFDTLSDVEANSQAGDLIFVGAGGTLDGGIALQDRQRLLGEGSQQLLSIQDNRTFVLSEATGGNAVLTNTTGGNVVDLADDNIVRGIFIDGTVAANGIAGTGSNNGTLQDNTITGAGQNGIALSSISGDWNITNNTITNNAIDGLRVQNTTDSTSIFTVTNNNISDNGFDGVNFANFESSQVTLTDNITDGNGRDGVRLINHQTAAGQVNIVGHTSTANTGRGIFSSVTGFDTGGDINIVDAVSISENGGDGIRLLADEGASFNANIVGTDADAPLEMTNNALTSGSNIFIAATGAAGSRRSAINTNIENVDINLAGSLADAVGIDVNSTGNASTTTTINSVDIEKSLVANVVGDGVSDGDVGVSLNFANNGGTAINVVDIEDTRIVTDNGIAANIGNNTLADITIAQSTIQGVSAVLPGEDDAATDAPFTDTFGDIGINIQATGNNASAAADSLTRLTISDTLIRDFSGNANPGSADVGTLNGVDFAQQGSAVNIETRGDANLLLDFRNNRIFNNGSGANNDVNNDGVFNEATALAQDANDLFFVDAVKINAFSNSRVTASIATNLFRDNFERGLALETYDGATINASVISNRFINNDRGEDGNNLEPNTNNQLVDSGIFDFEAINNEEAFLRAYENPFGLNAAGNIIDADGDGVADVLRSQLVSPGSADLCLNVSNNLFELGTNLQDFSSLGNFRLGLDGSSTIEPGDIPGSVTTGGFGFCDQLISIDEALFTSRFSAAGQ